MNKQVTYLKTANGRNHKLYAKITDTKIIFVDSTKIEVEEFADESRANEIEWYMRTDSFNMVEATKDEFDNAYILMVAKINELATI